MESASTGILSEALQKVLMGINCFKEVFLLENFRPLATPDHIFNVLDFDVANSSTSKQVYNGRFYFIWSRKKLQHGLCE